jgi:hypothetical protein
MPPVVTPASTVAGSRGINQGGNGDGTPTTAATVTVFGMGTVSQARFDLNWDGLINGADAGKFGAYMGVGACGSAGVPPTTVNNSGTFQQ